ncbi:MAG TPA: DsbA family protein [Azospirillaceae bacterium]|nr:DsbA family protein [Azospirillaceae bacterium]
MAPNMRIVLPVVAVLAVGGGAGVYFGTRQDPAPSAGGAVATANAATPGGELATTPPPAGQEQNPLYAERVLGNPNAPVTVIEYSSLTCPHCANFHNNILPQLKADYIDTGKVKIVYRDFPFDRMALAGAMAARCLPADRYFPFVDILFRSQEQWTGGQDPQRALQQTARLAGLSEADFQACVNNQDLGNWLLQRRLDAEKQYSVTSTPTFVINNGRDRIVGAQPADVFRQALDRALPRG